TGADREGALHGPAVVLRDAALSRLEHAGADGDGREIVGRTSRHLPAIAHLGEPRRSRMGEVAVSRAPGLPGRLRPLSAARAARHLWSWNLAHGKRMASAARHGYGDRALPHLEPVPRQRSV